MNKNVLIANFHYHRRRHLQPLAMWHRNTVHLIIKLQLSTRLINILMKFAAIGWNGIFPADS